VKKVPKTFFEAKTLKVAKSLLGTYLVRQLGNKVIREKITEVEAYIGEHDLACHASRGRTARTEVMFKEAGTIYVYLIYGVYWMLNVVTEEKGSGAAVLIRATQNYKGPGILTRELKINKSLNDKPLGEKTGLWIEAGLSTKSKVLRAPRVGVDYAGDIWAKKPYRFILKD
jgi:DNA-3-methyladenine glycosylase